jgi:ATP-dependent Lon protease
MRRSVKTGDPGLRLPPLLLDGPPGIGKSAWARHLGHVIGVPTMAYEATTENASFGLVGTQRSWGSANPGRLINTILSHRVGNPVVVVDEVEKSGQVRTTRGGSYNLTDALLPLLEPMTASNWSCPYFEVKFDMRFVIWVLTSNDYRRLPEPFLSRCPPVHLQDLSIVDLVGFARREGRRRGIGTMSIDVITEALRRCGQQSQISLRTVVRMIEKAIMLENGPEITH